MKILAICGSLRKNSYNQGLLNYAIKNAPSSIEIKFFDIGKLPFFNDDLIVHEKFPDVVQEFRDEIKSSNAILISSPEYNHTFTGVLKNALEWASIKEDGIKILKSKKVAIMGATTGGFGTAIMQDQLKLLCMILGMDIVSDFDIKVSKAKDKFDQEGNLVDKDTQQKILNLLKNLDS